MVSTKIKSVNIILKILGLIVLIVAIILTNNKYNKWKDDFFKREINGIVTKIEFGEKRFLIIYNENNKNEIGSYGDLFKDKIMVGDSIVKFKDSYNIKLYRRINDSIIVVYQ